LDMHQALRWQYSASTAQMKQAMAKLVDRAVASGDIRLDLGPLDLLRALAGVANIGLGPDGERAPNVWSTSWSRTFGRGPSTWIVSANWLCKWPHLDERDEMTEAK
jgi:hypothetical protein